MRRIGLLTPLLTTPCERCSRWLASSMTPSGSTASQDTRSRAGPATCYNGRGSGQLKSFSRQAKRLGRVDPAGLQRVGTSTLAHLVREYWRAGQASSERGSWALADLRSSFPDAAVTQETVALVYGSNQELAAVAGVVTGYPQCAEPAPQQSGIPSYAVASNGPPPPEEEAPPPAEEQAPPPAHEEAPAPGPVQERAPQPERSPPAEEEAASSAGAYDSARGYDPSRGYDAARG